MRLEPVHVMHGLFADIHPVHVKVLLFRLRCLSHRLMCFGWEDYINEYEPREKALLGTLMAQRQHDALMRDAYQIGDDSVKSFIRERLPHLTETA